MKNKINDDYFSSFKIYSMKQPAAKTEMHSLNGSHEEDNSSSNSTEYTFQDFTKKVPLDR